jgi:hypothetical protein
MYKPFAPHPFIERLHAHPGFASGHRALIAEAEAHPILLGISSLCAVLGDHAALSP